MMKIETIQNTIYIQEIPQAFLDQVRKVGLDAQGQQVKRYRSEKGGDPCRDVLRRSRPGEEVILASFCPFTKSGPYKEFGPIFVLAHPEDEIVRRDEMPLVQPEPEPYLREQFVLRAYNQEEEIIDAALVKNVEASTVLNQFFSSSEVAFVDARFPVFGCFACRINRE